MTTDSVVGSAADQAPAAAVSQQPIWRRHPFAMLMYLGIATLAVVVRILPVLRGGGLGSYGRYDDGVYYTASDALIHGRVPYRDFVLLHPPGLMLFLTPFTLLGTLTSDPIGMATARVAFIVIGAVNAVLVAVLASRWGRRPAIVAGVLYACWLPAVYSEQSTLLEPLGGTFVLIGLLLLLRDWPRATRRDEVLAGLAFGLACSVKIWYAAPLLAVVCCVLAIRHYRGALRIVAGAAASITVVCLPFFVLAPTRMWRMVVLDQVVRRDAASSRLSRLNDIVGVQTFFANAPTVMHLVTAVILTLIAIAAIACFVLDRRARVIVVVLVVNFGVLITTPPFFTHYAALTAAPAVLVLAIGLGKLISLRGVRRGAGPILAVAGAVCLASGLRIVTVGQGSTFPGHQFAAAAPAGCITADDPQALIQMDRLSSDLAAGCPVPVDVTGITYDSLRRETSSGLPRPRIANRAFQTYLYDYLVSGTAFVRIRPVHDDSPPSVVGALDRHPALATKGKLVLRQGDGSALTAARRAPFVRR